MIELHVSSISTFLEPGASASTAAEFAGLFGYATIGAPVASTNRGSTRNRGYFCGSSAVVSTIRNTAIPMLYRVFVLDKRSVGRVRDIKSHDSARATLLSPQRT